MLQISLLLMKRLNKTETPIFLSVVCSLFPKAIFLTFIQEEKVVPNRENLKVIISLFETVKLSILISPINLFNTFTAVIY